MKKLFLTSFLIIFILLFAFPAHGGFVPCGLSTDDPNQPGDQTAPCQLCDIFVMLNNIANFVFIKLIPPVATLMLVIGGVMFLTGAGNPSQIETGRKIMTSVAIGLVIVYAAWLVLGLFFQSIGLAAWTTDIYKNWWTQGIFQIPGCP